VVSVWISFDCTYYIETALVFQMGATSRDTSGYPMVVVGDSLVHSSHFVALKSRLILLVEFFLLTQ
jgi:hypothetical protein